MNIVPIAFAFDKNLILPAGICISSLLQNAKETTFYDIFILHPAADQIENSALASLPIHFKNCRVTFIPVQDMFAGAYEIRDITTPTYYRLLIPSLITQYNKVIYADVDIVFQMDLADVYASMDDDSYVAATYGVEMNVEPKWQDYVRKLKEGEHDGYYQAGFMILNSRKLKEDGVDQKMINLSHNNYRFQDQDIVNIACSGHFLTLPPCFNMTTYSFYYYNRHPERLTAIPCITENKPELSTCTIHFNGQKPWKGYCPNFDIWWEYYRKSPFFDQQFYFDFFYNKLDELDRLPLWKRVKILARYFVFGKKGTND